jgi:pilus assembly protein Flp/PilA
MKDFSKKLMNFVRDEEGLTMTEYAVAGGLVTAAAVAAFTTLGGAITEKITEIHQAITGAP